MTPQEIVEESDCEVRILSLCPEGAANLRDLGVVLVQLETGSNLNLTQPTPNADYFTVVIEESPFVFHLAWDK
jgi:hypothetical protein